MTDIFDEVDEILGEVDTTVEETVAAEAESNFNESELQDIMAEIESLEKDFAAEPEAVLEEPAVKKTHLQEEIEREIALSQEVSAETKEELVSSSLKSEEPKILSFEKKAEPIVTPVAPSSKHKSSEISFAANGQMNLNLTFKVGEEIATLTVDPIAGLIVVMNGVELCLSETEGCKVTMDNGVNFTIPLTTGTTASKKKAA